jgi:hypothetical protein
LQPVLNDTDNTAPPEESGRASVSAPLAPQQVVGLLPIEEQSNTSQTGQHLIFASTVIEDQAAAMPHYQDELLKLIITLPVQGQTQNVQFNFHLVEDDPVEVAKEMVAELGIPQDAVLEIGGTISALARQARMKQGNYRRQQQTLAVAMQGNTPAIIPAVLVTETQPPQQVYPLLILRKVRDLCQRLPFMVKLLPLLLYRHNLAFHAHYLSLWFNPV